MKNLLKPVVLVGGLLSVLLIAIAQSSAAPSVGQPTALPRPTASLPPGTGIRLSTPTAVSPMLKGKRPPKCVFSLPSFTHRPEPPASSPSPEALTFSEPQVVLTHTSAIGIAGWLPDGQRLLITKELPGTNRQAIEIFNTRTREEFVYAERHSLTSPPVWLASQESVGFVESTLEKGDALRLSHNREGPVETLRTHLASSYLAVDSTGEKVAFLLQDQGARPAVMDLLGRGVQLFNVELPLSSIRTFESIYHAAWRPRGNEIAFYNDSGLYLLDTVSGQACEVALGLAGLGERGPRWAYLAKWSPNGRYLAMITTSGRFPLEFSELTILDTVTGDLHTVQPERHLHSGKYYVLDIDWAPDSTTIAARVAVAMKEGVVYDGLYVMSTRGAQQERQLPELTFTGASAGLSLSWSPNGKYLALNCPTSNEGQLCQIAVTRRGERP